VAEVTRSLFIGGPIDGQERVLQVPASRIWVDKACYYRLFAFGSPQVFVYSVWNMTHTIMHLWNKYTGGRYAAL